MSLIAYPNALKYREQATDPWSTATIFAKADLESLADKFDTTETYTEGEIVLYQGGMYKCKAGGAGPGAWDATEWDQTTVEAELAALQTEVDSVRNTLNTKADEESLALRRSGATNTGAQIENGTYFYLDGTLKRAISTIAANADFTDQNCETVTAGGLNEGTRKTVACGNATLEISGNVCVLQMPNVEMPASQVSFIPSPYRPKMQVWGAVSRSSGTGSITYETRVSVETNGNFGLQINSYNTTATVRGQLMWII